MVRLLIMVLVWLNPDMKIEAASSYRRTTSGLNRNRLQLAGRGAPGMQVTFSEVRALYTSERRAKRWL